MAKHREPVESVPDFEHGWADHSSRFALDALLRDAGFKIHARPKTLSAVWCKGGSLYTEKEALRTLDRRKVADAGYLQRLYEDGIDLEDAA